MSSMTSDSTVVHEAAPVRIALLGCGAIGEIVARNVYSDAEKRGYEVVAVIDRDPERARTVATLLGVEAHASLASVQQSMEVDAVDIRLPHDAHSAALLESLERGLHVLVEKPLATTLEHGRRMRDAVLSHDRVVAVAENYPHLLAVSAARKAIAANRIGEILTIRSTRAFTLDGIWVRGDWRVGPGQSAGILLDQGTHHTSLLRALGGEIVSVAAQSSAPAVSPNRGVNPETVVVTARFASGLVAHSLYCWGTPAVGIECEGVVFGTEGRLEIRVSYESCDGCAVLVDGSERAPTSISAPENYYDSHRSIILDWVSAIRDGHVPRVTVADALKDLEVVIAARQSVELDGAIVRIGERA